MQSGLSKQWDFSVTQEMLRRVRRRGEGRDAACAECGGGGAAGRDCGSMSTGWTSSTSAISATEWTMRRVCWRLGIRFADAEETDVQEAVALKYLCDARQEIKDRIAEEIESSRGLSEQKQAADKKGKYGWNQ